MITFRPALNVRHVFAALFCAGVLAGATLPALAADPAFIDSDFDGLSDQAEITLHGTNPYAYDTDFDGLSDGLEWNLPSNPLYGDTDGDGYSDGYEYQMGTDLLSPDSHPVPGLG